MRDTHRDTSFLLGTGQTTARGCPQGLERDTSPLVPWWTRLSQCCCPAGPRAPSACLGLCHGVAIPQSQYLPATLGLSYGLLWETRNCAAIRCCH